MESPEPVSRVSPPITTMQAMMAATARSQMPTARRLSRTEKVINPRLERLYAEIHAANRLAWAKMWPHPLAGLLGMLPMRFATLLAAAASISAIVTSHAQDIAAMDMTGSGMAMPPMTLPPMPAIYAGEADKQGAPVLTGYSDHHHPITTSNPQTQAFFDQG